MSVLWQCEDFPTSAPRKREELTRFRQQTLTSLGDRYEEDINDQYPADVTFLWARGLSEPGGEAAMFEDCLDKGGFSDTVTSSGLAQLKLHPAFPPPRGAD